MPSVTIDTCVLAAPPLTSSREEIFEYVETLLDWKKLLDEPWVAIYMSENAAGVMIAEKVYPLRDELRRLFLDKGIVEYDANTVGMLADRLLQQTPSFETYFRLRDILATDVVTTPDLLGIHTAPKLTSELARCVILIAILRSYCQQAVLDHNLIVKPWKGTTIVQVSALIHDIDCERDDLKPLPIAPELFSGDVLVCQSFRELVMNLDENAIWHMAQDEVGLELATKIAVYKSRLERHIEPDWDRITGFSFGKEFFERSMAACQANPPGFISRLLRSLVETIDGMNMSAVHALRAGQGGNAPQRMRGQDKAWRRNIDYEYHLHYWECEDSRIEFASVGPHNQFDIPE